jgi:predicted nucleotidyltransferase
MDPMRRLRERLAGERDLRLAYLFGSRATGRAAPGSDWDVAVLFERGADPRRRLALAEALREALGAPVDLVSLERAPVEFATRVVRDGVLLVARSEAERVEYEAMVLARASDLAPLLERQRREILEGGGHDRAVERYRAALGAPRGLRGPGAR